MSTRSIPDDAQDDQILSELMRIRGDLNYFIAAAIPNRSDAEDVFQEVSMKIWRSRRDFALGTDFKAWAFTIARFTIMDWRKRYATRRLHYLDSETIELLLHDSAEEILDEDQQPEFKDALAHCLNKLPAIQEKLLQLHYRDRIPIADIAIRLSNSTNSAKQTLYRIRKKLKKCIEFHLHSSLGHSPSLTPHPKPNDLP